MHNESDFVKFPCSSIQSRFNGVVPQVYLECSLKNSFPKINLSPPYRIEKYRSGDEKEWTRVQNLVFGPEKNRQFEKIFLTDADKAGVFFAYHHNQIVGIAAGRVRTTSKGSVYVFLDWVGVLKKHQGKQLGYALSIAVLNHLKNLGVYSYVSVRTPRYRKPAKNMYLKLGFVVNFVSDKKSVIARQEMRANTLS